MQSNISPYLFKLLQNFLEIIFMWNPLDCCQSLSATALLNSNVNIVDLNWCLVSLWHFIERIWKENSNFRTKGCHKMATGNAKTSPNIGLHARKLLHLLVLFKFSIDMRNLLAFKFRLNEIHRLDGFILGRLKQIIKTDLFIFSTDVVIQAMKCELTSDVTFVGDIWAPDQYSSSLFE